MCNKLHVRITPTSSAGVFHGFVPCGKCYDCRESLKNSWVFRLRFDLAKLCEKGWKIGFFTLTYSDRNLPFIPRPLFNCDYRPVPCFNKSDLRTFFKKLKRWLLKEYSCKFDKENGTDTRIRYMVCSEFGEHTQRPHYHGIICYPPNVDSFLLHRKIKELWYHSDFPDIPNIEPNQKGFVFPFDFNGGRDSHGYVHKGFVCSSVKAAALYAAKYVCKDIAFNETLKGLEFRNNVVVYKKEFCLQDYELFGVHIDDLSSPICEYKLSDYKPFHIQSKSLGLSFLDGLSESQALEFFKKGYAFIGDDRLQALPVYLKNKILFTPKYKFEVFQGHSIDKRKHDWSWSDEKQKFVYTPGKGTHCRLVRREARQFFRDNLPDIFEAKVDSIADKFSKCLNLDFWRSVDAPPLILDEVRSMSIRNISSRDLAKDYLAFFGVRYDECYSISRCLQWYRRYEPGCVDLINVPLISEDYYNLLHFEIGRLFLLYSSFESVFASSKLAKQRVLNKLSDFHKSNI